MVVYIESMNEYLEKMFVFKYMLFALCFVMSFLLTPELSAQESQNQNDSVTISTERIDDLIGTLEDEAKRQEFLETLKTMAEADESISEAEENVLTISDKLGLHKQAQNLIDSYNDFLDNNNLNGTIFGKTIISLVAFLIFGGTLLGYRKLCYWILDKLQSVKRDYALSHDRFPVYVRVIKWLGTVILGATFIYTLILIWFETAIGIDATTKDGDMWLTEIFNLSVIILIVLAVWEIINTIIEYSLKRALKSRSGRLNTLLPIIRKTLFLAFGLMFTLVLLSEIGINIVPLLAGAGVLGIAIGFGAQNFVKDFLVGFTILLEDIVQVGDVASVGGKTGLVEQITIRKIQLRDLDGKVYTVPFSDISIIENWTKDYSYYLLDVGIAYREDTDEVITYLKEIDEEMRNDDKFKDVMLEPIEVLGVDKFADSAVIIKARLKTKPIMQWMVGREFNRRMKYKFDEHGVEIPFPHQTIYFGEDKKGNAPAAPVHLLNDEKPKTNKKDK